MKYLTELGFLEKKEQIVVSSRMIADKFEKQHKNVVRDINKLIEGMLKIEHTQDKFIKTSYYHEQNGEKYEEYLVSNMMYLKRIS